MHERFLLSSLAHDDHWLSFDNEIKIILCTLKGKIFERRREMRAGIMVVHLDRK